MPIKGKPICAKVSSILKYQGSPQFLGSLNPTRVVKRWFTTTIFRQVLACTHGDSSASTQKVSRPISYASLISASEWIRGCVVAAERGGLPGRMVRAVCIPAFWAASSSATRSLTNKISLAGIPIASAIRP